MGLQYLEQRYFDPVVGRFLTPDWMESREGRDTIYMV